MKATTNKLKSLNFFTALVYNYMYLFMFYLRKEESIILSYFNIRFTDELQRVLGFDWILMFLQGHIHATTVNRALKILLVMFRSPQVAARFRDGVCGGGWLKDTEMILKQQTGANVLGKYSYCCLRDSFL